MEPADAAAQSAADTPGAPLRLFIAIELPEPLREALADLIGRLRKAFHFTACSPSWVAPASMHLTLRFLGATPPDRVEALKQELAAVAGGFPPPRLRAMELGVFPDWKRPRVLWVGVRDKNDVLRPLQAALEAKVRELGFEAERQAFRPHLTLARFRRLKGVHVVRPIAETHKGFRSEVFAPAGLSLMQSELGPEGARYTRLSEARFASEPV
jgi:RNA 2',3'-cyclic 3'-phosphodiesterase